MQQFINTLFNPDVLDKLGLAGLTLVAIVVSVWLLLLYARRQQQDLANILTASQERQAAMYAESMQTVKQSLDNNTRTLQMLNDNMSDLRGNMGDLRDTVHELYGFMRYIMGRDSDNEKEA
jgi:predicted PurR-regulated permease PerM